MLSSNNYTVDNIRNSGQISEPTKNEIDSSKQHKFAEKNSGRQVKHFNKYRVI